MQERLTLGSLFDGSGGFPLAGAINGWEIRPAYIVTFGSPCQDLSAAGKQKGLIEGDRSCLFFEAVRIVKEMRNRDRAAGRTGVDIRPRFLVWENVPGAFSSNGGEDFRAVLEAIGGIAQDGLSIPRPPKGKWNHAGCVVGDGWSIAWRVYDAQYWRVPQRRKRIYLVADLASERAGEILFERESLCGDPAESREARKGIAGDAQGGTGGSGCAIYDTTQITSPMNYSNPKPGDPCHPLAAQQHPPLAVYDARGNGTGLCEQTLTGDNQRRVMDYTAVCVGNGQLHQISMTEQANTLDCMHDQQAVLYPGETPRRYIVRRLTPLECCRLQGFPDWWEDGVEGSDSARYKMWGNGIALPCAVDVLRRIAKEVEG